MGTHDVSVFEIYLELQDNYYILIYNIVPGVHMFNPFRANTGPSTKFTSEIAIQPELPKLNNRTFIAVDGYPDELERLAQNEKSLLNEKQHLDKIFDELQYMVRVEMETKERAVNQLKGEVSKLRNECEKLAIALKIPMVK